MEMLAGKTPDTNREMAYADVKAAWERYLANDNAGRGVVLIGHDQGAGVLIRLIANEIDGKPVEDRIVSAILPGANLSMVAGQGVGGSFKTMKLCASSEDLGCAIAWSSFRADKPPPPESLFWRGGRQGDGDRLRQSGGSRWIGRGVEGLPAVGPGDRAGPEPAALDDDR